MAKKIFSSQLIIAICLMANFSVPLFPQNARNSESQTWVLVSNYLDRFLADPTNNFPLLKQVDDLMYWTLIYNQLYKKNYVHELFSKQFAISDIDKAELGIILYLLKAYSSPASYEAPKPIISRIIEISTIKPEWFARNLLLKKDWREITRLIVEADIESLEGQRKGLKDILTDLRDQTIGKELIGYFNELDNEERKESGRFEEFMKDPSGNLDKIRDIYNLGATLHQHDMLHLDQNRTLEPKDNSIFILQDWIRNDTNIKKIQVLFHLLKHCISPYHREELTDTAIAVLFEHQALFFSALKDEPNWRIIIGGLSDYLPDRDEHFNKTLAILGDSDIEMKVRSQLEFLRKINDSEH